MLEEKGDCIAQLISLICVQLRVPEASGVGFYRVGFYLVGYLNFVNRGYN